MKSLVDPYYLRESETDFYEIKVRVNFHYYIDLYFKV